METLKQKKTILVVGGAGYIGSMANRSLLDRIFSEYHIDAVMHFASFCQVGESVVHPDIYYRNNFSNTLTWLMMIRKQ